MPLIAHAAEGFYHSYWDTLIIPPGLFQKTAMFSTPAGTMGKTHRDTNLYYPGFLPAPNSMACNRLRLSLAGDDDSDREKFMESCCASLTVGNRTMFSRPVSDLLFEKRILDALRGWMGEHHWPESTNIVQALQDSVRSGLLIKDPAIFEPRRMEELHTLLVSGRLLTGFTWGEDFRVWIDSPESLVLKNTLRVRAYIDGIEFRGVC